MYFPLFRSTSDWVEPVAVCDPCRENADRLAEQMGVPAFYDLKDLVKARPMEAAFSVDRVWPSTRRMGDLRHLRPAAGDSA